ncbi:MAG: hypothetical protein IMW89_16290 [Ktedonobacteraceae bacterium]|nr:hypothetical protein [Ktedonobacteraceae bacterium]
MRIRRARQKDVLELAEIERQAAQADDRSLFRSEAELENWLEAMCVQGNVLMVTDDDDELNQWGQAGTLEGLEGEIVGYTVVDMQREATAYRFVCEGAVLPQYRRQNAGNLLLVGALNHARLRASEYEHEGWPIYFDVLLPVADPAAARLAAKHELVPVEEMARSGLQTYRREL